MAQNDFERFLHQFDHEDEDPYFEQVEADLPTVNEPYKLTPFGRDIVFWDLETPHYKVNEVNSVLRDLSFRAKCGYILTVEDFCFHYPFKVFGKMLAHGSLECNYATAFYATLLVYNTEWDPIRVHLPRYFSSSRSKALVHRALKAMFLAVKRARTIVPARKWKSPSGLFTFMYPAVIADKLPSRTVAHVPAQVTPGFITQRATKKMSAKKRSRYQEIKKGNVIIGYSPDNDIVFTANENNRLEEEDLVMFSDLHASLLYWLDNCPHAPANWDESGYPIASAIFETIIYSCISKWVQVSEFISRQLTNDDLQEMFSNSPAFGMVYNDHSPFIDPLHPVHELVEILETSYPITSSEIVEFFTCHSTPYSTFDEGEVHCEQDFDFCQICLEYNEPKYISVINHPLATGEYAVDDHIAFRVENHVIYLCEFIAIAKAIQQGDPTDALTNFIDQVLSGSELAGDVAEAHGGAFSTVRHIMGTFADIHAITNTVRTFLESVRARFAAVTGFLTDWAPIIGLMAFNILAAVLAAIFEKSHPTIQALLSALILGGGAFVGLFVGVDMAIISNLQQFGVSLMELITHPGLMTNARALFAQTFRHDGILNEHNPYALLGPSLAGRRNMHEIPAYIQWRNHMYQRQGHEPDDGFEDEAEFHANGIEAILSSFASFFPTVDTVRLVANFRVLYMGIRDISSIARFLFEFLPATIQCLFLKTYPKLASAFYAANPKWIAYSNQITKMTSTLKAAPNSENCRAARKLLEEAQKFVAMHDGLAWAVHGEKHISDYKQVIEKAEAEVSTLLYGSRPLMINLSGKTGIGKSTVLRQLAFFLSQCYTGTRAINRTYQVPPGKYWENVGNPVGAIMPEIFGTSDTTNCEQADVYMAVADGLFKPDAASIERKDQYLDLAYFLSASNTIYPHNIPGFHNYPALWGRCNMRVHVYLAEGYSGMTPMERAENLSTDSQAALFPHLRFALYCTKPPSESELTNYQKIHGLNPALVCPEHKAFGATYAIDTSVMTYEDLLRYTYNFAKIRRERLLKSTTDQYNKTTELFEAISGNKLPQLPRIDEPEPNSFEKQILEAVVSFCFAAPVIAALCVLVKNVYDSFKKDRSDQAVPNYGQRPRGVQNLVANRRRQIVQQVESARVHSADVETPNPAYVFADRLANGVVTVMANGNHLYGFLLDGQTVLVPLHILRNTETFEITQEIVKVIYNVEHVQSDVELYPVLGDNFFIPNPAADIAILVLPTKIPGIRVAGKNLSYFTDLENSKLSIHEGAVCALVGERAVPGVISRFSAGVKYTNVSADAGCRDLIVCNLVHPLVRGDCGSLLWATVNGQLQIIGMYVAGNTSSFFVRLYRKDLLKYINMKPSDQLVMMSPSETMDRAETHAKLNPKRYAPKRLHNYPKSPSDRLPGLWQLDRCFLVPSRTALKATCFKDCDPERPCRVAPAVLDPDIVFGQEEKYGIERHPMHPDDLRFAEKCVDLCYNFPVKPLRELTILEAVNSIPPDASVGFGWTCKRTDLMPLVTSSDGDYHIAKPELIQSVQALLDDIDEGYIPMAVLMPCLKDETRKLQKIADRATRTFQRSPLEWLILGTMGFGDFMNYIHNNPTSSPSSVGIDPASIEWDIAFSRLFDLDANQQLVDCDYKSMEATELWQLMESFLRFTTKYYQDYGTKTWKRRYAYLLAMCQSIMVFGRSAWLRSHGNPSGMKPTTDCNTYCADIFACYCFHKLIPEATPQDMKLLVRKIFNGDDTILCVSPLIADRFNFPAIRDVLAQLNIVITPAIKDGEVQKFVSQKEVQFCKKQILYSAELGAFVPFVPFHDLLDQLSYLRDPSEAGKVQAVNSALQWSFFRGRNRVNGQMPPTEPTFQEQREALGAFLESGTTQLFSYADFYDRFHRPRAVAKLIDAHPEFPAVWNDGDVRQQISFTMRSFPEEHSAPKFLKQHIETDYSDLTENAETHFGFELGPFKFGLGDDLFGDVHPPTAESLTKTLNQHVTEPVQAKTTQAMDLGEEFLEAAAMMSGPNEGEASSDNIDPEPTVDPEETEEVNDADEQDPAEEVAGTTMDNTNVDQGQGTATPVAFHIRKKPVTTVDKIKADPLAAKWFFLKSFEINSVSPGALIAKYDLPLDLATVGNAALQIARGRFYRCDFSFRFVVTTGSFSGGCGFACFIPYGMNIDDLRLIRLSTLPHVQLDYSSNQPHELHVPFSYVFDYFSNIDIQNGKQPMMGSVVVVNQEIMNPTTGGKPVTLAIHYQINNLETFVPINVPGCVKDPKNQQNALFPPSERAEMHSGVAMPIRNGELITPAFNSSSCQVILGDKQTGNHLGQPHHSQIAVDEFNHDFFAQKPCLVATSSVQEKIAEPVVLFRSDMSPYTTTGDPIIAKPGEMHDIAPCEWVLSQHAMWHGGQRFRLEFLAPRETTVRVAIIYLYGQYATTPFSYQDAIQYPTIFYTFDATNRDITFEVPDINPSRWKLRSDICGQDEAGPGPRNSNGTIYIMQINNPSGINVDLTSPPFFNLWKSCASDATFYRFSPNPAQSFDRYPIKDRAEFHAGPIAKPAPGVKTAPTVKKTASKKGEPTASKIPTTSQKSGLKAPAAKSLQNSTAVQKSSTPKQQKAVVAVSPLKGVKIPVVKGSSFADQINRPIVFKSEAINLKPATSMAYALPCMLRRNEDNLNYIPPDLFDQMAQMFAGWSGDATYDIVINGDNTSNVGICFGTYVDDSPIDSNGEVDVELLTCEIPAPYTTNDFWPSGFGNTLPNNSQVIYSALPLCTAQVPCKVQVTVPYINPVRYSLTGNVPGFGTRGTDPVINGFMALWNAGSEPVELYITIYRHAAPGARLHHFTGIPPVSYDCLIRDNGGKIEYANYPGTHWPLP